MRASRSARRMQRAQQGRSHVVVRVCAGQRPRVAGMPAAGHNRLARGACRGAVERPPASRGADGAATVALGDSRRVGAALRRRARRGSTRDATCTRAVAARERRARPPAQPVDAPVPESPELSRAGAPTKPHAPTPTEETSESDYARVGGATAIAREAPAARYAPAPAYPEEARWEQRTGRVVLSFHIRLDGTVGDARVLDSSGHADLDHAAIAALHEWKFDAPPSAMLGAWYRYAFRFDLM